MGVLGAIIAALKALPAIESLVERFFDAWQKHSEEQERKEAIELKAQKDRDVDAAIDGPVGLRDNGAGAAQQQATDRKN